MNKEKIPISEPVPKWKKQLEEEMEKDVMAFNYVYFLGKKFEKDIPNTAYFDYKYIKRQKEIAEHLLDKDRLKQIKRDARQRANEDFKIIWRALYY